MTSFTVSNLHKNALECVVHEDASLDPHHVDHWNYKMLPMNPYSCRKVKVPTACYLSVI